MNVRLWIGIAAACATLAACEGSSLFSGQLGTDNQGTTGTGSIQGTVLSGGTGLGGVSVVLIGRDSTTTGTGGVFVFDSLPAATYQVAVRVPIGYSLAAGQTGTQQVSVTSGGTAGVTVILQQTTTVP